MSSTSADNRTQALAARIGLIGVISTAIGVLIGVLLVPTTVIASDTLTFVAGDILDVGPLPDAEDPPRNSYVFAADGSQLDELRLNENREPVTLDQIPLMLQQAVIATEDREYYDHHGINIQAILRAGFGNIAAGGITGGGSTITQQYVKNAFLTDRATEQTLDRKIVEAVWAVELERRLSKDEILERYLNRIYFGAGAYGVQAAAERYFSKDLDELTLAEAATLAGVIRDPRRNDPLENLEASRARRDIVLGQMAMAGFITPQQRDVARATPLEVDPSSIPPSDEPFWIDWVTQQLYHADVANPLGPRALELLDLMGETQNERITSVFQRGLRIHTTLDPELQEAAREAIRGRVLMEDATPEQIAREPFAGIVSVEPGSGAVRVMALGPHEYGSCADVGEWADVTDDGELLCHRNKVNPLVPGRNILGRQPGSAFKPFVIAAALEAGIPPGWTVDSRSGQVLEGCGGSGEPYAPRNAGGDGFRNMYDGVQLSVNVFHAKLAREIGPPTVADLSARLGLRSWPSDRVGGADCSIGLGATDVVPLEMASAYATLANRGEYCAPYAIERIEDADGNVLWEHTPDCTRVISTDVADRTVDIMKGPVNPGGTAGDMQSRMGRHQVRGKTGTTNDSKDAWFVGFVQQLSTAAWIGYPNGPRTFETPEQAAAACGSAQFGDTNVCDAITKLMRNVTIGGRAYRQVFGGTIPAPMWGDFMVRAVSGLEPGRFTDPGPQAGTNVPDLSNVATVAEARRIVEGAGLNLSVRTVEHHRPEGTIIGQSPAAGARVSAGSIVFLEVSDGKGQRPEVPDVIGLEESEAIAVLEGAGYRVEVLQRPTRDEDDHGRVVRQSPRGGEEADPDDTSVVIEIGVPRDDDDDDDDDDDEPPGRGRPPRDDT